MGFVRELARASRRWFARWRGEFLIVRAEGDMLPEIRSSQQMIQMLDDGKDWSVGFLCPCGCGETIELLLPRFVSPRWSLVVDDIGRPTLSPSVWRNEGCRSHFFVKRGRVVWV